MVANTDPQVQTGSGDGESLCWSCRGPRASTQLPLGPMIDESGRHDTLEDVGAILAELVALSGTTNAAVAG